MVSATPVSPAAERWQRKFDTDFPEGLTFTWEDDSNPDDYVSDRYVWLVPWIEVVAMEGFDPVVVLQRFNEAGYWNFRIVSYEVLCREPVLMARVAADYPGRSMLWSGLIGCLRHRMALQRKQEIEYHNARLAEGLEL